METTKHPQDPKNDFSERIKAFNKITDPVKKSEEGMRLADEMYAANAEKVEEQRDMELRFKLVSMAGFSLDEVDLVYQFVKGNNNALSELKEFRQWKKDRIYSSLTTDRVDEKECNDGGWAHHQCPNSNCRKVFE